MLRTVQNRVSGVARGVLSGTKWTSRNLRQISTRAVVSGGRTPLLVGALTGLAGYTAYQLVEKRKALVVFAASEPSASQPSVYSQGKDHALYLWIHLKPEANSKQCAKVVANIQKIVDSVTPPDMKDEDDEILAGVGFGSNFYGQVAGKTKKNFGYPHRKGILGDMPSTGGDIFIHAKCNTQSKLFELAQKILTQLPPDSISKFEDIYSFVYRGGRDLSGFIDGTENPADVDDRKEVAVEKETGGSYVITQKWIHKLDLIEKTKDSVLEGFIGRSRPDSVELSKKPVQSHVARMTGGTAMNQKKIFQIVRQSMPYGNLHDKAGLFFIGYAASPENFEFMLDRMVGSTADGLSDDVMRLSTCVAGNYWYFPSVDDLKKLA